ncbi:MAG TPA: hypothetical protein DDX19_09865 [Rhodopirellula baltica]|uniref:Uncharacterized protein n=1 Tax=Rhodopirellula baltica (strain DSM 10527 / NCIMB 13988 / SH1) TaxID=243090 RepID=Q7UTN2_RHOBA|nr:hypothetical protein [Rhodopirellula baltica]CAD73404.1 hypothetical protein-signal peptide and transmembrane prediction [Rhodopirellula baltica SH 1]HBE63029.1 hypothetical protein [Rhodopirellula baltica]
MPNSAILVALVVLFEVGSPSASTKKTPTPPVIIDTTPLEGNTPRILLVNEVKNVWSNLKVTEYTHRKDKVIDLENGVVKFDCSGFVGEVLLKTALPDHYQAIEKHLKKNRTSIPSADDGRMWMTRPLAGLFYDYFDEQQPDDWLVFRCAADLKPGDLIVARYEDSWRVERNNTSTGHIMVAWEIEPPQDDSTIQVRVFDSSNGAHTKQLDTRHQADSPVDAISRTGIGSGVMQFRLNDNGEVTGYKWSLTSKRWHNLVDSEEATGNRYYDRLEGILFARPIEPEEYGTATE